MYSSLHMPILIDDAHLCAVLRVLASVQAVGSDVYILSSISENCKYSSILSIQLPKVSDSYLMDTVCIFFIDHGQDIQTCTNCQRIL